MPSTKLRIELLGGFRVSASGCGVADDVEPRRKPAALSKRLALTPRHRYRRERLRDARWPDREPSAVSGDLRKALHQARNPLEEASSAAGALIHPEGDAVAPAAAGSSLDAELIEVVCHLVIVGPTREQTRTTPMRLDALAGRRGHGREHGTELERLTADDDGSAPLGRVLHIHSAAFAGCLSGESPLRQARGDGPDGCPARSRGPHASLGSRSVGLPWVPRAEPAACCGAYDEATTCSRDASGVATVPVVASHVRGRAHATAAFAAVEQGDPEQVVRSRHSAATSAARYGDCLTCSALMNPLAAEGFTSLDDADGAHVFANAAVRVAASSTSAAWRATARAAAGSAAKAEGDAPVALEHFASAGEHAAFAAQPYGAQRSSRLASAIPA